MIGEKKLIDRILRTPDLSKVLNELINIIEEQPKTGEWIPCSERLPENISTVIIQVREMEIPTIGWYGNMSGWRLLEKDFVNLKGFTVVAWMPLPKKYEKV